MRRFNHEYSLITTTNNTDPKTKKTNITNAKKNKITTNKTNKLTNFLSPCCCNVHAMSKNYGGPY